MIDMKQLESKLESANYSVVFPRSDDLMQADRGPAVPLLRLPDELIWLSARYSRLELYSTFAPQPRNGWQLGELTWWPRYTVNQDRGGDPSEYPYFEDVWQIATYARDGGELIAVDLHEGPNFGRIGWVTQTDIDYGGGAIVVALSFTEWLERTLDLGPDASGPYWRQKGFKDYGPLIPDDPYYRPVEPLHEV